MIVQLIVISGVGLAETKQSLSNVSIIAGTLIRMRIRRGRSGSMATGAGMVLVVASALVSVAVRPALADRLEVALSQAYRNNPQLNAQRAATRAVDEGVSVAVSGYRPRVTATTSLTDSYLETVTRGTTGNTRALGWTPVAAFGVTGTQSILNGFQTANRTRQSESQVFGSRETLRGSEQTVLLNAVTAYMNLLRDGAILELQRSNVRVLEATLRQARDRWNAGEVTLTDVAQAESRLAGGRSVLSNAESNYTTSRSNYRQVIGVEPGKLAPATPVDRLSPTTLEAAIMRSRSEHPTITVASYNVDAAVYQVKIAEGALYPTLQMQAAINKTYGSATNFNTAEQLTASIAGALNVPIYQGGAEYATIRQAKETLGQRKLDLDTARDQVRQTVVQSWGQLQAAKAQIEATTAQVNAAEIALNGVREEARVGQRTTLDVLNAQQDLVNARVALVTAQRDRVVASYTVLAATGALSPQALRLPTQIYDPVVHYQQVRDSWFGVRTPDGR